jgi:hypothetical protein
MTDQLIYLNASGMRPETIAYLKSMIEKYRTFPETHWGNYTESKYWEGRADLAVEILEMEGVKYE